MVGGVLGGSCILSRVSVVAVVSKKQLNVHLKAGGGPRPLEVPGGGGEWFLALTPVCFPSLHSPPQEEEDTLSLPTSHPIYPPETPSSSHSSTAGLALSSCSFTSPGSGPGCGWGHVPAWWHVKSSSSPEELCHNQPLMWAGMSSAGHKSSFH